MFFSSFANETSNVAGHTKSGFKMRLLVQSSKPTHFNTYHNQPWCYFGHKTQACSGCSSSFDSEQSGSPDTWRMRMNLHVYTSWTVVLLDMLKYTHRINQNTVESKLSEHFFFLWTADMIFYIKKCMIKGLVILITGTHLEPKVSWDIRKKKLKIIKRMTSGSKRERWALHPKISRLQVKK